MMFRALFLLLLSAPFFASFAAEYQCMSAAKKIAGTLYTQGTGIKYDQAVVLSKARNSEGIEMFEIAVHTYARYNIRYKVSAAYQEWVMDRCNIHYIEEI